MKPVVACTVSVDNGAISLNVPDDLGESAEDEMVELVGISSISEAVEYKDPSLKLRTVDPDSFKGYAALGAELNARTVDDAELTRIPSAVDELEGDLFVDEGIELVPVV